MADLIPVKAGERMVVQIITGMGSAESLAAARAREKRRIVIAAAIAATILTLFIGAVWVLVQH